MKLITILLFVLGVFCGPAFGAGVAAGKPNVLIILADDQGWGDLSVNGNTNLATPHVDSLASAGAMFDRFYVCPVCAPTRAEFLTGRYHPRSGVFNVTTGGERMDLAEKTIADTFKAVGYAPGAFGKWHNGMQYPYHPRGRGFDEYYGFCSGHWGDYFDAPLEHNGQLVTGNCLERLPPDGEVSTVRVVPCTESHAAQVITDYRFVAGSTWSGQDRADARVAGACQLTVAERDEGVRLVAWAPSEASWNRGDRTGLCLATIDGGGVTGSFLDGSVTLP